MIESIATPDRKNMDANIKHEVGDTAHLPTPSSNPPPPDNKDLVSPGKEEISHDEMAAMRELAIAASAQMQKVFYTPTHNFHPKTGRIRTPRETSDSESSLSDNDTSETDPTTQGLPTPQSVQKLGYHNTASSHSTSITTPSEESSPSTNARWVRTSKGKYAINPIKCPPCARRKKADKCRGGPPCGECWSRGRKTAASCQEWGEGWEG